MSRDPILLTPGPLTTSLRTRLAMLRDWGSWDTDFRAVTARVRGALLEILHATESHVLVPLQGSGTFSVEAAVGSLVPRDGHLLVLDNGAYCKRAARLATQMGRRVSSVATDEARAVDVAALEQFLQRDASVTHVLLVHCETGAGVLNPLESVAEVCARHGRGLLVDAMSSFGALPIDARRTRFDALIAASGKCLEGVPGMGFVFVRKELMQEQGHSASLSLDLHDQYRYMEQTGQWRFTPPTHVVVALDEALRQYAEEGGQAARLARYTRNCQILRDGLQAAGVRPFLDASLQAPVIVTFHAPAQPDYRFADFYAAVRARGFIIYPGKLTQLETFRVGCIGAIGAAEMEQAVFAITSTLGVFAG